MSTSPFVGMLAEPDGVLVPVNWPAGIVQVRVVFAVVTGVAPTRTLKVIGTLGATAM
jgi:hypothetical protein